MTFDLHRVREIAIGARHLLAIALLLLATAAEAASLTTIHLNNRPAEEIIPVIKPMLGAGEVITGQGFKIFLRASPQTGEDVRQMVEALDVASKMLLISVAQGSERDLETLDISGSIRVDSDNASIGVGNQSGQGAGSIDYNRGNTSAGVDASSSTTRQSSKPVHRLRVAEGRQGFIETGAQIPYFGGSSATTEFKRATTGFYVLPRLNGNRVTLEVSPFKNSAGNNRSGTIETQQANTTITGPLGQWLQIGGVSEQFEHSQTGIASQSSSQGSREDSIWIKAELLR